jgi:uncharacterized coiled-coil DUF342 family protein
MSLKQAYEHKMQTQLDEWSAEIDKLKAKADSAEADQRIEYYKKIDELHSMHESTTNKLNELKNAGDDAWADLKAGIDSLNDSMKSAIARFK